MRHYRIILLSFILACKGASLPSSSEEYYEDLSYLRPELSSETEVPADTMTSIPEDPYPDYSSTADITEEIDSINRMVIRENSEKKYWDGYTIQVYRGNSRKEARASINKARDLFPESDPELIYYQPTFRVKMGAYFDRAKANKAFQEVKEYFPSALLLPEQLELPKSEDVDR